MVIGLRVGLMRSLNDGCPLRGCALRRSKRDSILAAAHAEASCSKPDLPNAHTQQQPSNSRPNQQIPKSATFSDQSHLRSALKRGSVHPSQRKAGLEAVSSEPNLKLAEVASCFRALPLQGHKKATRTTRLKRRYRRMVAKVRTAMAAVGLGGTRVAPIAAKVRARHLELEPLCCLSSCLVRGGCTAVLGFELAYVVSTLILIFLRFYDDGRFRLWSPFEANFNAIVTHQLFLYVLAAFDVLMLLMVLSMSRALMRFNKELVRLHWLFDLFALGFNACFACLYILALSVPGPRGWTVVNLLLVLCLAGQVPVQMWAITVVKSCYDFFVLLHVLIGMAEA